MSPPLASLSPTPPTKSSRPLPRWFWLWGLLTAPGAAFLLVTLFWQRFPLTRAIPFVGDGSFESGPLTTLLLVPFLGLYNELPPEARQVPCPIH